MHKKEQLFADLLTKQKRDWIYPVKRFELVNTTYRPDFYIPKEELYIEVVGSRQAYHANKGKINKFKELYPHIKFIIVDYNNEPYLPKLLENRIRKCADLHIRVSSEQLKKLQKIAQEDTRTLSNVLQIAIENYIKIHFQNRLRK